MHKRSKFQIRSDASKQRWVRDDKKEAFWRGQIEKWQASGLSKRAFCLRENLSQSSFGAWCRELRIRDREFNSNANAAALLSKQDDRKASPFVPLHILPDELRPSRIEPPAESKIEVLLPGGCIIRLGRDSDFSLVKELVEALEAK